MTKQKQIQDVFVPTLTFTPNGYGFGQDWTLVISKMADGQVNNVRHFWLGQDAKVCSRIMGQRIDEIKPYILIKHKGKPDILEIRDGILDQLLDAYGGDIEQIFAEAKGWELAAE